jgi:hypothetical protein
MHAAKRKCLKFKPDPSFAAYSIVMRNCLTFHGDEGIFGQQELETFQPLAISKREHGDLVLEILPQRSLDSLNINNAVKRSAGSRHYSNQ